MNAATTPETRLTASTVARVLRRPLGDTAHVVLRRIGREAIWSLDLFVRLTASVLVLRVISQLVGQWFFPREIWEGSDQLLKGFAGAEEAAPPPEGERPQLVYEHAGWRFYAHRTQYQGQLGPCPLLKPEPCATCEWFVPAADGKNYCAAVVKVATRLHDQFRNLNLYEIRDEIVRSYGTRVHTAAS